MHSHPRGSALPHYLRRLTAVLALVCLAPVAGAQEATTTWTPPPPEESATGELANGFDWVKVPSGEWLGGEIKVLYEDNLEFDSDEIGLIGIDWSDVVEMRTTQTLEVRPREGESVIGRVVVKDGKVNVIGATTTVLEQASILAITAGEPRERNFWSGVASGSANYQSGNTDKETMNARITVKRRTVEQRMVFDYIGNYDETESEETENNHRLSGDWDRFITDRWFWTPISAEYFKDKFQNIEHRATVGVGLGYEIIDTSTTEWRVSAGPAYTKTWFQEVQEGESDSEDSPAFQARTRFDHELTDDIDIWYDYRALVAKDDAGGYSHRMETGIAYEIIGDLDLRVTWIWDHLSNPTEDDNGEEPDKDDTQLLFGVGYSF
jgi:putative salt-induced outer membrane protein YdiY